MRDVRAESGCRQVDNYHGTECHRRRSVTARHVDPKRADLSAHQFLGSPVFMPTSCNAERPNSEWGTHMGRDVFLGQPRHCVGTNTSHGLSAVAEFLVPPTAQAVRTPL